MEEKELIQKVLSGDSNAFAAIVRDNQAKVLGLCLSFLSNSHQAEDAAQEIFIKAYQSLKSFRQDSSFSTWLYRIAANHCKDLLRKKIRERTDSLEAILEESGDSVLEAINSSSEGTAAAISSDLIEKILSFLSPDERLILTLREVQGLSYDEIAGTLGCSLDAVKARLRRAREALVEKTRHFSEIRNV